MRNPLTVPYCQMTALDGLAIAVPILVVVILYFYIKERKNT